MAVPLDRVAVAGAPLAEGGLSIVIPVLNDGAALNQLLSRLQQHLETSDKTEIIVSDGGSRDDTLDVARHFNCRIIRGAAGRSQQLNRGANVARFGRILFLHADTRLPDHFQQHLLSAGDWGFFKLRLSGNQHPFRLIESMINWRSSLTGISTGDQAQFFSKDFFKAFGGYPDIPLMEDVAISKKAKSLSTPSVIDSPVVTSSRRWVKQGIIRTILLMWWLRFAFWIGISADKLHRLYYSQRD